MAKKTLKTSKQFDLKNWKQKNSPTKPTREKEYYTFPPCLQEALGSTGFVKCATTQILGFSDTGKTTAILEAAIRAQEVGDLPVFLITENKFSFDHAKTQGLQCEQVIDTETGEVLNEWDGDFLFKNDFENMEEMFDYMRLILDSQISGDLPRNVVFLLDSIGSIHGKRQADGAGGNMHDAKAISDNYRMNIAGRIESTKYLNKYKYTATAVVVNQCYVDMPSYGAASIKPYGGNGVYYPSVCVILFGNQTKAGTGSMYATYRGRQIEFGKITRVKYLKNHDTGVAFKDGKIGITPHGYIENSPTTIAQYKKDNLKYFATLFKISDMDELKAEDFTIEAEDV
jgi:RecA/RadA recombinase